MGYQFGDISKSIGNKISSAINEKTGKDTYQFGDLTKWLDQQAKQKAASLAGKGEGEEYEFGDLSRWVDSKVKEKVNDMSGKSEYEFGDLTKEILKRIWSGEIDIKDVITLCKILLDFGAGLTPVAGFFPVKILIELLNYSILQDVGGRVVGALAQELDRRVKSAITGDSEYQLGDITKKEILKYVNKDEYAFGDITKTILANVNEDGSLPKSGPDAPKTILSSVLSSSTSASPNSSLSTLSPELLKELEGWDKALDLPSSIEDLNKLAKN